ncbi:MAG: putative signal transducing protein [Anaerolineae bacterium]
MLPKRKAIDEDAGLICVYVTSGLYQAQIIRGKLEANNIPVLLKYESLGPVMGLTVDGLGQVEVWVPRALESQARSLLEESGSSTSGEAEENIEG